MFEVTREWLFINYGSSGVGQKEQTKKWLIQYGINVPPELLDQWSDWKHLSEYQVNTHAIVPLCLWMIGKKYSSELAAHKLINNLRYAPGIGYSEAVRYVGPATILELGTGGDSAISTAMFLHGIEEKEGRQMISIDRNPLGSTFVRYGKFDFWNFVQSDSVEYLRKCIMENKRFDMVFIDSIHTYLHTAKEMELSSQITNCILLDDINDPKDTENPKDKGGVVRAVKEWRENERGWNYIEVSAWVGMFLKKRGDVAKNISPKRTEAVKQNTVAENPMFFQKPEVYAAMSNEEQEKLGRKMSNHYKRIPAIEKGGEKLSFAISFADKDTFDAAVRGETVNAKVRRIIQKKTAINISAVDADSFAEKLKSKSSQDEIAKICQPDSKAGDHIAPQRNAVPKNNKDRIAIVVAHGHTPKWTQIAVNSLKKFKNDVSFDIFISQTWPDHPSIKAITDTDLGDNVYFHTCTTRKHSHATALDEVLELIADMDYKYMFAMETDCMAKQDHWLDWFYHYLVGTEKGIAGFMWEEGTNHYNINPSATLYLKEMLLKYNKEVKDNMENMFWHAKGNRSGNEDGMDPTIKDVVGVFAETRGIKNPTPIQAEEILKGVPQASWFEPGAWLYYRSLGEYENAKVPCDHIYKKWAGKWTAPEGTYYGGKSDCKMIHFWGSTRCYDFLKHPITDQFVRGCAPEWLAREDKVWKETVPERYRKIVPDIYTEMGLDFNGPYQDWIDRKGFKD